MITLKGEISDAKNVDVKIEAELEYTNSTGEKFKTKTTGNGRYTIKLASDQRYMVRLSAEGYHVQNFPIEITNILETKNHYLIKDNNTILSKPRILQNIFFDLSSAELDESSYNYLDKIFKILQENPTWKISVIGYADKGSYDDLDLQLSIERAQAIAGYLNKKGISRTRIEARGKGNTTLLFPSPNRKNRRVEMKIIP